ncbi:hypothetical protein BDQ12DRAFT_690643 [Crucibulum laeve]|uniref:TRAM1-like protein domain-containing protein n=1 Tax=Crucibulum laeve TaxID=68775 RepID=A0A5C3LNI8_9AGAR|nr:hypothetical protein BDQ12DRAFT_690643 [Crucibulum laeve]
MWLLTCTVLLLKLFQLPRHCAPPVHEVLKAENIRGSELHSWAWLIVSHCVLAGIAFLDYFKDTQRWFVQRPRENGF